MRKNALAKSERLWFSLLGDDESRLNGMPAGHQAEPAQQALGISSLLRLSALLTKSGCRA
jgi:hypothetical protein